MGNKKPHASLYGFDVIEDPNLPDGIAVFKDPVTGKEIGRFRIASGEIEAMELHRQGIPSIVPPPKFWGK